MKILTVIGARPQFIKSAPLSHLLKKKHDLFQEVVVHTGQHFDDNMSNIFFKEFDLEKPKYNLSISDLNHGAMTGRMIEMIESIVLQENPDYVLVYGDTNSTLAAAIAAVKIGVKIVHIEAGLRSFNMNMPEEINRILVDRVSDVLFCPSELSKNNLATENITKNVHIVGDIMRDCINLYSQKFNKDLYKSFKAKKGEYFLATLHRAENTDNKNKLEKILTGLNKIAKEYKLILPIHPRTRKKLDNLSLWDKAKNIEITEPLSFFEIHALLKNSKALITDSGGMQKEAFYHGVPCITLRDETEWVETIDCGMNTLVGSDIDKIVSTSLSINSPKEFNQNIYGDGTTAIKILDILSA